MRSRLLLRSVRVGDRACDVLVWDGRVAQIGRGIIANAPIIEGRAGRLLPGLHDHHIHLLATAAARDSVSCSPPGVATWADFETALRRASGTGWIRAVGYDEHRLGPLDRRRLDAVTDRPVRVQHRGGSLWYLNSAALKTLGLVETHPDGRLWREGQLLGNLIRRQPPDLTDIGLELAQYGITGVTDATPGDAAVLANAARAMPQRVVTMGVDPCGHLEHGPLKIVVSDHQLPGVADLENQIALSHRSGRPVAVHSVTRESLLLCLAAFEGAGTVDGDRIEHAAVSPPEAIAKVAELHLTVVTQPSLITRNGDAYLAEVEPADVACLWPYGQFLAAGARIACSSDAPYGDVSPWNSIRSAADRTTAIGRIVGPGDRVDPNLALESYLSPPNDPGGRPREIQIGAPADLVLLEPGALNGETIPSGDAVRLTLIGGNVAYQKGR